MTLSRDPVELTRLLTHKTYEVINLHCFKLLNLWEVVRTAIETHARAVSIYLLTELATWDKLAWLGWQVHLWLGLRGQDGLMAHAWLKCLFLELLGWKVQEKWFLEACSGHLHRGEEVHVGKKNNPWFPQDSSWERWVAPEDCVSDLHLSCA